MFHVENYAILGFLVLFELFRTAESANADGADKAPAGVWVVMAFYMCFLIGVAVYHALRKAREAKEEAAGTLKRTTSKLEEHYIAGRDLGPWSLALTLLASTWSGYTVVGAPEDTYRKGWNATRYMGGFVITQSTMLLLCARLQWYAFKRRYQATVDFVTDRFRSNFARIFTSAAQLAASALYVMGQFKAIGSQANGLSGGAIDNMLAAAVMCIIMLGYEFFGGMKAIALTDLAQGLVLIVGCILYFPLMETVFDGGIQETTRQLRTCSEAYDKLTLVDGNSINPIDGSYVLEGETVIDDPTFAKLGCPMPGWGAGGDIWKQDDKDDTDDFWATYKAPDNAAAKPNIYPVKDGVYPDNAKDLEGYNKSRQYGAKDAIDHLTITKSDIKAWLPFYVAGISFPVYPQILVRFYTARNVKHLQYGMQLTHLSVFYLCLPAFLTGYTTLSRDLTGLDRENADLAFPKIMNAGINYNALFYITGCLTVSAAIAAYMSTADSALMAASSTLTLEWVRDYYYPRIPASDNEAILKRDDVLYIIAKCTSLFFGVLAVWSTKWKIALVDLYIIQGGILMLACPPYFFGMYCQKVNAMAINVGIFLGTVVFFGIWGGKAANSDKMPEVWGTIVNILVVIVLTYIPGLDVVCNKLYYNTCLKLEGDMSDPYDPELFPEFLTFDDALPKSSVGYDIRSGGGPKYEPIRPWWINFIVFMLLFLAIPFWVNLPSSYEQSAFSGAMPTWAVCSTFFAATAMLINIFQTYYNWEDWIEREGKGNLHNIVKYSTGDEPDATSPAGVELAGTANPDL